MNSVPAQPGANRQSAILKPGQQASLSQSSPARPDGRSGGQLSQPIPVQTVDIDRVMAWRNGAFNFEGANLQEVMRQLARWYDIEVVYEKGIPDIHFVGEMSRDITLSGVLKALEASNVHFKLEDNRRLIVLP